MKLGERIRAARESRGWSQADLARRVGVSQPAIKKIEAGETVKSRYLPEVFRALGIDQGAASTGFHAPALHDDANVAQRRALAALFEGLLDRLARTQQARDELADPIYRRQAARLFAVAATAPLAQPVGSGAGSDLQKQVDFLFHFLAQQAIDQ